MYKQKFLTIKRLFLQWAIKNPKHLCNCKHWNVGFIIKKQLYNFKGATKLYFTHYSCVVIISFITGLWRSAYSAYSTYSTISFWKVVFCLSVLSVFFVLNQIFSIKTLKYVLSCHVILLLKHVLSFYLILLCNFVMWFCYKYQICVIMPCNFAIKICVIILSNFAM